MPERRCRAGATPFGVGRTCPGACRKAFGAPGTTLGGARRKTSGACRTPPARRGGWGGEPRGGRFICRPRGRRRPSRGPKVGGGGYNPGMSETEWLADELRRNARALNARRRRWPLSGPSYYILADALAWADEAPPWPLSKIRGAENALRCLWHYRTGLILGEERPFAELWELAVQLFPRWVGFHPSRRLPSRRFRLIFRAGRRASARWLVELEREIDRGPPGD